MGRTVYLPYMKTTIKINHSSREIYRGFPWMLLGCMYDIYVYIHPGNLTTFYPKNGALEDDFPFESGDFKIQC